jgi:hypothetical protein
MKENFKVKEQTVLRQVEDNFIIVPIAGNLSSKGALFRLNETAADIWKFINENKETTIEQVNKYISELYKIDQSAIKEDIENIINTFFEKDLLEEVPD